MNFGDLLHEIPQNLRDLIRKLEKDSKKHISNEWSNKFNLSCLNHNKMPMWVAKPNLEGRGIILVD